MKTLPLLAVSLLPLSATPENSLIPETWFQEITATDGSTQQSIIFTTTPGVEYTFYHSQDLAAWTEVGKTYGLGQQFAAAMRETAPAPPPPDPQNPPPATELLVPASISIARSSGTAGGTVVSWPSLDHGNAMRHLITATMATEWDSIPIFAESHGSHWFAILPSSTSVAPPAANGFLGQKDAAMIADLEAGFATFSQAVTTSVITARNTPPPPPPAPDSRGFWRIKADWSLDSDNDGSLDHVEFFLAATQGAATDGLIGNAFNADSNNDGIPDGEQLDGDGDGIPDSRDIASEDKLIGYEIIGLPRYAVFETDPGARQINDRGTLLYDAKVWKNGAYLNLVTVGEGMPMCEPVAMNDLDAIIGDSTFDLRNQNESQPNFGVVCYWATLAATPTRVNIEQNGETMHAERVMKPDLSGSTANDSAQLGGNRFSNDGEFHAHAYTYQPPSEDPETESVGNKLWKISAGDGAISITAAQSSSANLYGSSVRWGVQEDWMTPSEVAGPRAFIGGISRPPPYAALNIIPHINDAGTFHILTSASLSERARILVEGSWAENELLAPAIEIATNGTAIGKPAQAGEEYRIMLNGKWTDLSRAAPGLPALWESSATTLVDTTGGGWILARNATASAAMLPIRIKGRYTKSDNTITEEAAGVDDFSIGSTEPDLNPEEPASTAVDDRIWIMAPLGATPKEVVIDAPLHSSAPLKMSGSGITFGGQAEAEITESGQVLAVSAGSAATTGSEVLLDLKMGSANSISKPIGMKVMKARTVNVTVYKVADDLRPEGSTTITQPDLIPTETQLENFLNDTFRPQVNITFKVTIKPTVVITPVDSEPNGQFDYDSQVHSQDQLHIALDAKDQASDVSENNSITIYLLGTRDKYINGNFNTLGVACPPLRTCWVMAIQRTSPSYNIQLARQLRTIAHEIGHIVIGPGHPGDLNPDQRGPAPLPGTRHTRRLMWGNGTSRESVSPILVKGEWDEIEEWLVNEEDSGRIPN